MVTDFGQLVVQIEGTVVQTVVLSIDVLTIGRLPDNGLVLNDQEVSRRHAEVRRERSGVTITDLSSANGTFVNGARLPANQPHVLPPGAVIGIGRFVLSYRAPEPTPPTPAPRGYAAEKIEETIAEDSTLAELELPPVEAVIPTPEPAPPAALEEPAPVALDEAPQAPVEVVEVAPQLPIEPPPVSPPSPSRPTFPMPRAEGPLSRYLKYLPSIYQESDFLGRYLLIMESIWEPLERRQDHISMYFDPQTCPTRFLVWLASWLDLSMNERWPEERRRRLLAEATDLYRWRGTRYGMARLIEVCTGIVPEVTDLTAEGGSDPWPCVFRVRVRVPQGGGVDRELIESLVRAHKPAHAGYVLEVGS